MIVARAVVCMVLACSVALASGPKRRSASIGAQRSATFDADVYTITGLLEDGPWWDEMKPGDQESVRVLLAIFQRISHHSNEEIEAAFGLVLDHATFKGFSESRKIEENLYAFDRYLFLTPSEQSWPVIIKKNKIVGLEPHPHTLFSSGPPPLGFQDFFLMSGEYRRRPAGAYPPLAPRKQTAKQELTTTRALVSFHESWSEASGTKAARALKHVLDQNGIPSIALADLWTETVSVRPGDYEKARRIVISVLKRRGLPLHDLQEGAELR